MKEHQFGIMSYNKGFEKFNLNIGDYIQSIAASTFFENVDHYLEREGLDDRNIPEQIKIILNGWFMHSPDNWPPSQNLIPLLISFHITDRNFADIKMLSPSGIAYLKSHEPIGCRDYETLKLLGKYGIRVYFSGCLTLTLGRKYTVNTKTENIYFVDVPLWEGKTEFMLKYIPKILRHFLSILSIYKRIKERKENILYALAKACSFYCLYSNIFENNILTKIEFVNHSIDRKILKNNSLCFEHAEKLLTKYASAKLVVTSRLHCALPCLGMETPVIFINREGLSARRFEGLLELMRVFYLKNNNFQTEDALLLKAGKIGYSTKIENKRDYIKIKEKLEEKCKEFVRKAI